MKDLIIKNLKMRRVQVVSMIVSIAISAMVLMALFMLYGGVERGVALNEERGGADLMVVPTEAETFMTDSEMLFTGAPLIVYMNDDLVEQIAQIDGVAQVTGQFYGQTLASSCCSTGEESRIIGIDPATDWVVMAYCDTDVKTLEPGQMIVGCKVDSFPDGTGTVLGEDVTVMGRLDATGSSLDYSILMDINYVRQIAGASEGYEHFWERYGQPDNLVSTILVDVDDNANIASVKSQIARLGDFSVLQRANVIATTQQTLQALFVVMLAAGIILVIASLLQFMARFYSSVWERKAELALYRALGASVKDLQRVICGEAFAITGIGLVIGIVLGVVLYFVGYAFLQGVTAFPFSALPVWQVILGVVAIVVIFVILALVSIIVPLRQVKRIDPASAMQQVDIG